MRMIFSLLCLSIIATGFCSDYCDLVECLEEEREHIWWENHIWYPNCLEHAEECPCGQYDRYHDDDISD